MNKTVSKEIVAVISTVGMLKNALIPAIHSYFDDLGYEVWFGKSCFSPRHLSKSDDLFRAAELMNALKNPDVVAVLFARGGEYSERIIPHLKPRLVKNASKIIIGFSDTSSLLSYFVDRSKCDVYHGAMAEDLVEQGIRHKKVLKKLLKSQLHHVALNGDVLSSGSDEGILKGGCLSVLYKLLGNNYSPSFKDSILFLEDIDESLKSLTKMLREFKRRKRLVQVRGLLLGEMFRCGRDSEDFWDEFLDIVKEIFGSIPIAYNVPSGHGSNDIYLPLGKKVRLVLEEKKSFLVI